MSRTPAFLARVAGLFVVLFVLSSPLSFAAYDGPEQFVQNLGNQAIALLREKDETTFAQREAEFRKLLLDGFDMKTIGRFVLGRHVHALSVEELKSYDELFVDFIVRVYTMRFDNYEGETFDVIKVIDEAGEDVIVRSKITQTSGQPPVRADWRLRMGGNGYKIVDVYVEGISMLATQRSEFAAVIERRGVQGLLDELRTRANTPSPGQSAAQ